MNQPEDEVIWRKTLNLLSRRAYFSLELRKKLESAGFTASAIEKAIAKSKRAGYLDDEERAARMVESWSKKGWGPLKIRLELKKHGIAAPRSLDHPEHALFLARYIDKHVPQDATQKEKAKVIRFLLRRGFS